MLAADWRPAPGRMKVGSAEPDAGLPLVVIPWESSWRDNRGFRHYLRHETQRTYCGKDPDFWALDSGEANCTSCLRSWELECRKKGVALK